MNEGSRDGDININTDKLLDSERGMFLIEIRERVIDQANELIQASNVEEDIKRKCKEVVKQLETQVMQVAGKEGTTREDVVNAARSTITNLAQILPESDPEAKDLFEALRELILKARASVLGWKWPPQQI